MSDILSHRSVNRPDGDHNHNSDQSTDNDSDDDLPVGAFKLDKPDSMKKSSSNPSTKSKDLWGSVISEQTISEDFTGVNVKKNTNRNERAVETYDHTLAESDDRPHLADTVELAVNPSEDPFLNFEETEDLESFGDSKPPKRVVKRSHHSSSESEPHSDDDRNITSTNKSRKEHTRKHRDDRGGRYNNLKSGLKRCKPQNYIYVTSKDSKEKIVAALTENLCEPKIYLMERVYDTLGAEKTVELLQETERIEKAGGLMIMNGERRRTPGGVFLYILRNDKDIEHELIKQIFYDENKKQWQKEKRKKYKKRKHGNKKLPDNEMSDQLPENENCKNERMHNQPAEQLDRRANITYDDDMFDVNQSESFVLGSAPDDGESLFS